MATLETLRSIPKVLSTGISCDGLFQTHTGQSRSHGPSVATEWDWVVWWRQLRKHTHTRTVHSFCVCVYVIAHVCIHVCRSEVNVKCLHRSRSFFWFGLLFCFVFWDGLSLNLEFTSLANPADQRAPSCCFPSTSFPLHTLLPPLNRDYRQALPYMAFYTGSEDWI